MIDRAAIREAIDRLLIPDDRRFKIDAFEEQIVFACGPMFASLDSPNSYEAGSTRAAAALEKFAASAKALAAQMKELPAEAVEVLRLSIDAEQALRDDLMHPVVKGTLLDVSLALISPENLIQRLERFALCAEEGIPVIAEINSPAPRGRPRKQRPLAVTRIAAWAYQELTGNTPTRHTYVKPVNAHTQGSEPGGPFVEFLSSIFTAAGIAASPEAQAKVVLMEKKGTQ
ncbi:MAG: hypothetical protein E5Y15_08425 [Mesorhizobium sp.]|nr:MAG: hypothetical protein E5Y15_08425 [Mesorhizobium sp.]